MDDLNNVFGDSEQLWYNIRTYAAKAGRKLTRVMLELYYVVKSPETPTLDKTIIIAALGYQFLPKQALSREKHGIFGYADNVATLMLAYNRVKRRVTPQIEAQVEAIINQWFGTEQPNIEYDEVYPELPSDDGYSNSDYWDHHSSSTPATLGPNTPSNQNRPNTSLGGFSDDEDVVID